MKKLFVILSMILVTGSLFAQYAELRVYLPYSEGHGFSAKFDDGTVLAKPNSHFDFNTSGKTVMDTIDKTRAMQMTSPIAILNYFYSLGWEFVQEFQTKDDPDELTKVYRCYMLRRIKK